MVCDQCGHDSVIVELPRERKPREVRTDDPSHCPECGLCGSVVLHGATPDSEDVEDTFDVAWIDPITGGDYRT